jgi:S1-C subfamily serine protease
MKFFPLILFLAWPLTALADDVLAEQEAQMQALYERAAPSVVFLSNEQGMGSGFFVSADGLILTNRHVVGKSKSVNVVLQDGQKYTGQVIEYAERDLDLALVKINIANTPWLKLISGGIKVGSFVASVGHGEGGIWTFNTGMVSNIYPVGASHPVFQTQIPLNPGCSGGPVINRQGEVVGIVTAGIVKANSVNFAIKAEVAMQGLHKLAEVCDCLIIGAPPGTTVFVDNLMRGTGPRVVLCPPPGVYEVSAVVEGRMKRTKISFPKQKKIEM